MRPGPTVAHVAGQGRPAFALGGPCTLPLLSVCFLDRSPSPVPRVANSVSILCLFILFQTEKTFPFYVAKRIQLSFTVTSFWILFKTLSASEGQGDVPGRALSRSCVWRPHSDAHLHGAAFVSRAGTRGVFFVPMWQPAAPERVSPSRSCRTVSVRVGPGAACSPELCGGSGCPAEQMPSRFTGQVNRPRPSSLSACRVRPRTNPTHHRNPPWGSDRSLAIGRGH